MSIANYLEDKILDTLRNNSLAFANVYVKLHVGDPGDAGTANPAGETTRKAVTFAAPSGGSMASNADVVWSNVSTGETYSHISIWDAVGAAAGNPLWTGALTASRTVQAGDSFTIASGQLTISVD